MASNTAPDLGPLDWRISITDKAGRPTPEFQRRWATQRGNNDLIRTITTGNGSPVDPPKSDGDEYIDINATPPILYVGSADAWVVVGVTEFTQLSDVPHDYTGEGSKLVQVKPDVSGLQFNSLSSVLDTISTVRGTVLYRGASGWSGLGPGTSGYVLTTAGPSADPAWHAASAGSVTSVGLSAPSIFTVSGSPVTGTGTLTFSLNTEVANKVFAGPTTGAAAIPTFRTLVSADIPSLSYAPLTTGTSILYGDGAGGFSLVTIGSGLTFSAGTLSATGGGSVTSVALSAPAIFTVGGSPVTSSGTLTLTLATQSANLVWAGPTTGSAATPTFRSLVAADIPSLSYAPLTTGSSILYGDGAGGFSLVTVGSGLTFSGGTLTASGSGGTVTSVALAAPAIFTVSGSPVTGSGTLTFTLATQSANLIWAGPSSGVAATPTFRALASLDIPLLVLGFSLGNGTTGNNVATPALAPRAGSITKVKFVTKASDGSTALTLRIKQNGTSIFSANMTIGAGTAAGTVSTSTSLTSSPLAVAIDDVFTLDITSGTSTWQGTVQME